MKSKNSAIGYLIIIILLVLTSFFSLKLFFRERSEKDSLNIQKFPYEFAGWKGKDLKVSEGEYKMLETRNLFVREYTNSSNEKVILFIIYSETNRSVFHPPEVCLFGSGMKIEEKVTEKINFGEDNFYANKLYAEKNNYRELLYYIYKVGDFYTDNFYLQQSIFALRQIFQSRIRGATIRVSTAIKSDEKAANKLLKSFLSQTIKTINSL